MRIVAGRHRGRRLEAPEGARIRPTSDRAREALFNRLVHGGYGSGGASILEGAQVLDVFCGTGALGLEALSRGARHAIFLDNDAESLAWARRNARNLDVAKQCEFLRADATQPPRAGAASTLVFMDPPYDSGLAAPALAALADAGWLAANAIATVETDIREVRQDPPAGFREIDSRSYGKARVRLLRYTP